MLLCFLGVSARPSSPFFPFPSLPTLSSPCHLSLLSFSPLYITAIAASVAATATTTPSKTQNNKDMLVDYFINSLGFTKHEAISTSMQVNHLSDKPILVLNLLFKYGLTKIQIRKIVSFAPKVMLHKADKALELKIKFFFQELGFSGADFVELIKKNPGILSRGLDTCIIPTINCLKQGLGDDVEDVAQIVKDSPWLFSSPYALKRMQLNVTMLQNYGLANEVIRKFIIQKRKIIFQKPERFRDALSRVEMELGISRDSLMMFRGISALTLVSKATLQRRLKIFKSFGWTDLDIANMCRSQPCCLTMSEDRLRRALTFLMKELDYTSEYLASHATFMMYSMEARVKPRYEVLKILKENKLVYDKPGLYSLVILSESAFVEKQVMRYEDELPDLFEIYQNSIKDQSKD